MTADLAMSSVYTPLSSGYSFLSFSLSFLLSRCLSLSLPHLSRGFMVMAMIIVMLSSYLVKLWDDVVFWCVDVIGYVSWLGGVFCFLLFTGEKRG